MKKLWMVYLVLVLAVTAALNMDVSAQKALATPTRTIKVTRTPTRTRVMTNTPTRTRTQTRTRTPLTPTFTVTPRITATFTFTATSQVQTNPYPQAPLCPDTGENHSQSEFHTLWDDSRGCHYDHEHGTDPFTQAVADTFPGFDLYVLLGNVEVGHTNPSSPMENTHKHGGFKWDVMLSNPHGCLSAFEGSQYCVAAAVIQYHNFGDYSIEMEARIHSATALLKVCNPANPADCGYIYTVQHQEFGQRVSPYQGTVLNYLNNPSPSFGAGFGPYFTIDCIYTGLTGCRTDLNFIRSRNLNTNSIWTSKPTGSGTRPPVSSLLRILFRVRDTYQVFDSRDLSYPFTFAWVCSSNNGVSFNPAGCRWNNTTSKVHEVAGIIPAAWDNLAGFDTNPAVGRVTADGYTSKYGVLDLSCTGVSDTCFPVKVVDMFVGVYGDYLTSVKVSNTSITSNPERDICFTSAGALINCDVGGTPAGWTGPEN